MKVKVTNIIAAIGFILLFIVFAIGVLVAILFIFPSASMFGMVAVKERDTQVVYRGTVLEEAFAKGNIMVESNTCNVQIMMSAPNFDGDSTIVVNENATGIAFNSFKRTLVEWTETLVDDETYFKISIMEPSGVLISKKPTTVYINLKNQTTPYNFILHNRLSSVRFAYGDNVDDGTNNLHIENLTIKSALKVEIPSYSTLDIDDVVVASSGTSLTCGAVINNDVTVTGNNGSQNFYRAIAGDVTVQGNGNRFKAVSAHDVDYTCADGRLEINDMAKLAVTTETAEVVVTNVTDGVDMTSGTGGFTAVNVTGGIEMLTDSGNLNVQNIISGGLRFTATTNAAANVTNQLNGNVWVRNKGRGALSFNQVDGDVDIISSEINGGAIKVKFKGETAHAVQIEGYDGNITVDNINGYTKIKVRQPGASGAAGHANIKASFNRIINAENEIYAGAYVNSPANMGNVDVYLNSGWNNFNLTVASTRAAFTNVNGQNNQRLNIGTSADDVNAITGGDDSLVGQLKISAFNYVTLH